MNKIFVHCKLPVEELKKLRKNFFLKTHSKKIILNEDDFFKKAAGFNGIIAQGNIINKNFIRANKDSLRVISNVGVGYDNIDVDVATQNGVAVFNTPNLMNHAVADLTMGLLISLTRRICEANDYVKRGKWKDNSWDLFWGENLYSESLGIIGLGNIGKEVAKRATSFGLKLFYNNRNKLSD
ncbi:D-glycerate dehydrogenase, partial [Alphaproteobacteria bacterium]|nr:D-glycerate dehydrogenase [Alphaproteobacteria bacterium]